MKNTRKEEAEGSLFRGYKLPESRDREKSPTTSRNRSKNMKLEK
jgi:hypothetical protein